ncbi:MAG TPA: PP2C family protein-serine/threonine phosphatase [Solirubrobacteraceae bacterium]|nr:PP2C family protein-serine/threonine phosphatase [Solirubrobacteraceae bacterium]
MSRASARQQERVIPFDGTDADASRRRIESAQARVDAGARRDAIADEQDVAALARDVAAEQRAVVMAQLDLEAERGDNVRALHRDEVAIPAAARRRRAALRRAQAVRQRALAAADRQAAARDRERAARERLLALLDREALVLELRREGGRRARATRHQHSAEELARTLQRTLSPPRLPRIPGLDVAAHYEPFAPEEVGGDFYDLFPLAGGRTGFFLGDVCGKGPTAATLTSLARYTMRTAAMLRGGPEAIFVDLNAALLAEGGATMQTCTVVYGQIDTHGSSMTVTLAAAGHPPPIIVRAAGSAETAPALGTILGVTDKPRFTSCKVELEPGDAIFVYSDGILDTEIGGVRVDEQRVASLLEGPPDTGAKALVDRLVQALYRIDHPLRDDVALLALRRTR